MGLINYDRMFINNLSEKLKPFYQKIKEKNITWSEEDQKTFDKIKLNLKSTLELTTPDMSKRFSLETDALDIGIAAVLKQEEKSMTYISRLLKGPELRYSITEKELLAALWAMEKMEYYLKGREFDLYTDHKPLTEISKKRVFGSQRIQRWFDRISNYTFKTLYVAGNSNVRADILSRSFPKCDQGEDVLLDEQTKDEVLKIHTASVHRKDIMPELHGKNIYITQRKLKEAISDCITCTQFDKKPHTFRGFRLTTSSGEIIGLDIMELTKTKKIMLAIDYFSRKLYGIHIRNKRPSQTIKLLSKVRRRDTSTECKHG